MFFISNTFALAICVVFANEYFGITVAVALTVVLFSYNIIKRRHDVILQQVEKSEEITGNEIDQLVKESVTLETEKEKRTTEIRNLQSEIQKITLELRTCITTDSKRISELQIRLKRKQTEVLCLQKARKALEKRLRKKKEFIVVLQTPKDANDDRTDNQAKLEELKKEESELKEQCAFVENQLQRLHNTPDDQIDALVTEIETSDLEAPGKPRAVYVGLDSITLAWTTPDAYQECNVYQVSYRKNTDESAWRLYSGEFITTTEDIKALDSDSEYLFRVRGIYKDIEGPYSDVSDPVKTLKSAASKLLQFSVRVSETDMSPTTYALPMEELGSAGNVKYKTLKFEVGTSTHNVTAKTIMLVGETGTGKSTLINGMVNYILGVNWTDPFRYTLVNLENQEQETKATNQALSQTDWITCYTINHDGGNRIPYTINIIDTPSFGDTRGLIRDQQIVEQIRGLLTEPPPREILTIDAVCIVFKAPDARLTALSIYELELIMSIFGKDIGGNICALITFSDGNNPPVLAMLDEFKLPLSGSFMFNNSCLYANNEDTHTHCLSTFFWQMGTRSFNKFFKHLDMLEQKSLRLTTDVLNERGRLEAILNNLEPLMGAGRLQIDKLKNVIKCIEENEDIIAANKNCTYTVRTGQIEETRTYTEMKDRYERAAEKSLTLDKLLDTMLVKVDGIAEGVEQMWTVIMDCNRRLFEIALRPNPTNMSDCIYMLIENEKRQMKIGFRERIETMYKFKKRAQAFYDAERFAGEARALVRMKPKTHNDLFKRI